MVVAVGDEVDRVVHPDRVAIGVRLVRHVARRLRGEIVDVQVLRPAAVVAVPGAEVAELRRVEDPLPVRREVAGARRRHRQRLGHSAIHGYRVEPRVGGVVRIAPRTEQHRRAVRCPAVDLVIEAPALRQRAARRVVGELHRLAAAGRHDEHLIVAAVLAGERDLRAIRREAGRLLHARPGGQADRGAALGGRRPQVAGIREHHAVAADIREAQQPCPGCGCGVGGGAGEGREQGESERALGEHGSFLPAGSRHQ